MKDDNDQVTQALDLGNSIEQKTAHEQHQLTLVDIDQVDAMTQVRTDSGMDDESLKELGESIQAVGLLQLPLLRFAPGGLRFVIVAGHRRIEAMRRVGITKFYAIVGSLTQDMADDRQLAENIQREQLSMRETAAAVRKMKDKGLSLDEIAQRVKKSKSWVSKHIALTCEDFSSSARIMLETGECEDLEILHSINQLHKLGQHKTLMDLRTSGEPLTRDKVRELVETAKEAKRAADEERKAAKRKTPAKEKTPEEIKEEEFLVERNKWHDAITAARIPEFGEWWQAQLTRALNKAGGKDAMWRLYGEQHTHGMEHQAATNLTKARKIRRLHDRGQLAAYILGLDDIELSPRNLLLMVIEMD